MDLNVGGFGEICGTDGQRPEVWRHQLLVLATGFLASLFAFGSNKAMNCIDVVIDSMIA